MRYFFSILVLLVLVLVQRTLLTLILPGFGIPFLVIIFVLSYHLISPSRFSVLNGFLAGVLLDLTQPTLLGLSSLLIVFLMFLTHLSGGNLQRSYLRSLIFMAFASLVVRLVFLLPQVSLRTILSGVVLDVVFFSLLSPLMERVYRWMTGYAPGRNLLK